MSAPADAPTANQRPLRILQVVEPGVDGVFRVVELLVHQLLQRGHEVSLAYSDVRGSKQLTELVAHVRARGGHTLNLKVSNGPQPHDAVAFFQLAELAWKWRPDVVHAHSSKAGVLARSLVLARLSARYCYTPHAYYGLNGQPGLKTRFFNAIEQVFGRIGVSLMCSTGEGAFARETLGLPTQKVTVVGNPVDTNRFQPGDVAAARAKLGLGTDDIVLGAIGRLSGQKDPVTLYRAFAVAAAKEPRLRLLHVGKGELAAELQTLAESLGITDRLVRHEYFDQTAMLYHAMDALIMTSRYEGLSLVLLEALASDLPLLLSEVQGIADLRPERLSHCWTTAPGDVTGFAALIERWLADRPSARPRNHRTVALEDFSIDRWMQTHLALYQA